MARMQITFEGELEEILSEMRRYLSAYKALEAQKKKTKVNADPTVEDESESGSPLYPHAAGSIHLKPAPSNYPSAEALRNFWENAQKKSWSALQVSDYMRTRWPEADGKPGNLALPVFNELLTHIFKNDLQVIQKRPEATQV